MTVSLVPLKGEPYERGGPFMRLWTRYVVSRFILSVEIDSEMLL